jgi:hypothetical protein
VGVLERRWGIAAAALGAAMTASAAASAATLSNGTFDVQTGTNGEITSLQIANDAFPTNYVLSAANAPGQNTADHEWMGELMFAYRVGSATAWTQARTNASSDSRTITSTPTSVTVTYGPSTNAQGIKNFGLTETYSLVDDYLDWQITLTNSGSQNIEFGDVGLPLAFNEFWTGGDIIYQTRAVYHSFTGNNSSYITITRPSGVGPFLLMTPDATTGAGFEYMDNWRPEEHAGSAWAAGGGTPAWTSGLDVFYIHSNVIKSTNRGYLPNTSLMLAPGKSQTYAFKFFVVNDHADVQNHLFSEGLIDVTAVPGMMFASNMTAKFDLHTSKTIGAVTPQFPSDMTITDLGASANGHHVYSLTSTHLGQNDVTVTYGSGETTTLQFYVLEPIDAAIQRHATFMVSSMRWTSGTLNGVFDDWSMTTSTKRGTTGGGGWGDDWGWTKGEFLAEKNAQTPVASEVSALDAYLQALWGTQVGSTSYTVDDWWCPSITTANCGYNRAYAYPHAYNTFFSMYKIASRYPNLIQYKNSADTYLLRAYGILNALFQNFPPSTTDAGARTNVGYMGEQITPELVQALTSAGHTTEAQNLTSIMAGRYAIFKALPYPYASEYTFDNTGEEGVYTVAKMNGDTAILGQVNTKTRACRGQEPVWYYYADPVTNNGENWWQFQYTASLAGYCMDDWLRTLSTTPEVDERLSYAAKIANVSAINSGQIDSTPANLGTVAWTYQAMKGNVYVQSPYIQGGEDGTLRNGWRSFSGEADLGLFGALRILSADVSVDPVFGLYGYGCAVTATTPSCYAITPEDGVFKRLNLISQKLSMALDRDRYSGATVSTSNDYVGLTLQNQTTAAHTTELTLTGLAAGTYPVTVGGAPAGSVTAVAGKPTVVPLSIGTDATYAVQVGAGCGGATAGSDAGMPPPPPVTDGGASTTGPDDAGAGNSTSNGSGSGSTGAGQASSGSGSGAGSSNGSASGKSNGCGCTFAGAAASEAPAALVGIAALIPIVRRRRWRRR